MEKMDSRHAIIAELEELDRAWKKGKLTWLAYCRPTRLLKQHLQDLDWLDTLEAARRWREIKEECEKRGQLF